MSDEALTTRLVRLFYLLALLCVVIGSGLPRHAAAQSRFFTFEQNIDRPGRDYSNALSEGRRIVASPVKLRIDAALGPMLGLAYRVLQAAVG